MHDGKLRDVAKEISGTLVSPPLSLSEVEQHVDCDKHFQDVSNLEIIGNGVPAKTRDNFSDLACALEYGNHSTLDDHMKLVWDKFVDDVAQSRCIVLNKSDAADVNGVRDYCCAGR